MTEGQAGFVDVAFAYTGRWLDRDTGLQNNHHRWYDAGAGRWTSEDPIGFAAGDANLNRYVGNQPTGHVDPDGLEKQTTGPTPADPWWNDSGWDWINPWAWPGGRHVVNHFTGYYSSVDKLEEGSRNSTTADPCKRTRAGDIEAWHGGGSQIEAAARAKTEIKEFGRGVVADIIIEGGTAGADGIFGKFDDVYRASRSGRLIFDPATKSWTSPGGLIYGQGSVHGNRVKHVLDHLVRIRVKLRIQYSTAIEIC